MPWSAANTHHITAAIHCAPAAHGNDTRKMLQQADAHQSTKAGRAAAAAAGGDVCMQSANEQKQKLHTGKQVALHNIMQQTWLKVLQGGNVLWYCCHCT